MGRLILGRQMLLKYSLRIGLACSALSIGLCNLNLLPAAQAQTQTQSMPATVKTISVSMRPGAAISPLIYGANYVWSATPEDQFPTWINQMTGYDAQPSAAVSLFRYPGGWNGEYYDWTNNEMYTGGPTYTLPGEPPDGFLDYVRPMFVGTFSRAASFLLPTRPVITTTTPSDIPTLITQLVQNYLSIVGQYHNSVSLWEIGNEWWLQNGGANNTAPLSGNPLLTKNLTRYAEIIAAAAPAIKAAYPNVRLYATADWTTAGLDPADDQFVQLRKLVGPAAWALIDGVSVHTYCGATVAKSLCTLLPKQMAAIRQDTGISDIYASEWSLGAGQSTNDFGIRNASATVSTFQDMVLAGITKAAYWPSSGIAGGIALANGSNLTATGAVFRAMSRLYQGQALVTNVTVDSGASGQTVAVAAANELLGRKGVAMIIPSNGDGQEIINVPLAGTGLTRVADSSVLYSQDPDDAPEANTAYWVPLKVSVLDTLNGLMAQFVLNPGTPGRGSNWEIAVLELQ